MFLIDNKSIAKMTNCNDLIYRDNNSAVLQRELIAFSCLLCGPTYPFDATLFLIKKKLCDYQDMLIGLAPIVLGVS